MAAPQLVPSHDHVPNREHRKAQLLDQLGAILPTVYTCIQSGHDMYTERHAEHILDWTKATRATVIRDYVVKHIKEALHDNYTVRLHIKNRLFTLIVGDKVALRFKKLNWRLGRLTSSNVLTNQVSEWRNGTFTIPELNVNKLTCIDVGYVNDAVEAGIDSVWAVVMGEQLVFNLTEDYSGKVVPNLFNQEELPDDSPLSIKGARNPKKSDGNQPEI